MFNIICAIYVAVSAKGLLILANAMLYNYNSKRKDVMF